MIEYKSQDIKFDENKETLLAAKCSLTSGFDYVYTLMTRSGFLAVVDVRQPTQTEPVGVLCHYSANSIEEIEVIVNKMIHLYKNHQIITVLCTVDEFLETSNKIS